MISDFLLNFELKFADLYERDGLIKLDQIFLAFLQASDPDLTQQLLTARQPETGLEPSALSQLILDLAPYVEDFLAELFHIDEVVGEHNDKQRKMLSLFTCKRQFVQRYALKRFKPEEILTWSGDQICQNLEEVLQRPFNDLIFAEKTLYWLEHEQNYQDQLDKAAKYAAWASQPGHSQNVLFQHPQKIDLTQLIPNLEKKNGHYQIASSHQRHRDGFKLTDPGADLTYALDHAHYCIWCHNQQKDSCSKGLRDKKTGSFTTNILGNTLTGCPLEEKISEMNWLKARGYSLSPLAVIMIDNPMVPATGHRICNDCMKACIFQKQEPVNIPQIETRILKDVLALPWGFEIYSLLSRWNPLNFARPLPRPSSGRKILVAGMGPAGFTLAHHLLNDGHDVVGIDALKIEPLSGPSALFEPIKNSQDLYEQLDEREVGGFGGVAEYGITVRWDKNFLKIIRLILERRQHFSLMGGVRLGSTLSLDDAFTMGFDHVALCLGAGRPTLLDVPNNLAKGIRLASDFLMGLQLTGAGQLNNLSNLLLQLPVVVIGGGLTAIDTATEALAYYPIQAEKMLRLYDDLSATQQENLVPKSDRPILDTILHHARILRKERHQATEENRQPNFLPYLLEWGGVTVLYRRRLQDAPSYTLNHEEVAKAFEEGIRFLEEVTPTCFGVDQDGWVKSVSIQHSSGDQTSLPVKSVLIAAGTQPNTIIAKESEHSFPRQGRYFQAHDHENQAIEIAMGLAKPDYPAIFLHQHQSGGSLSYFGDMHPAFFGNVVKAMASAKQGYPFITQQLEKQKPSVITPQNLHALCQHEWRCQVKQIIELAPSIMEIIIQAPAAAKRFKPGQFFRLQNFHHASPHQANMNLVMEGLAMTGAWVDPDQGLISTIILDSGASSHLCRYLTPGEPIILMGPTGHPTDIPSEKTVLLIGGGLGNAVLFSIGTALRDQGCKVLYCAGYREASACFKRDAIEQAADHVIWCTDQAPVLQPRRSQDYAYIGNVIGALQAYAQHDLGQPAIPLETVDHIIVIGSDGMMAAIAQARHTVLAPYLKPEHIAIGSINSPMQCMMKEICAQCVQKHRNPETGEETIVFSCTNQDQQLDWVDFDCLADRLGQNSIQEQLTKAWLYQTLGGE